MSIFSSLFKKENFVKSGNRNDTSLLFHNMSLRQYEVKAVYIPTNRSRKLTLYGKNEVDILMQLTDYKKPDSILEIQYDPPTEAQLKFAKELKIRVPGACCKWDISALIDEELRKHDMQDEGKKWKHVDPGKGLIEFANAHHIPYSLYAEEPHVIRCIWRQLKGAEAIAFMIACMHKHIKGKWDFSKWEQWVKDGDEINQDSSFSRSLQNCSELEDGFYGFEWRSMGERTKAYQMLKSRI